MVVMSMPCPPRPSLGAAWAIGKSAGEGAGAGLGQMARRDRLVDDGLEAALQLIGVAGDIDDWNVAQATLDGFHGLDTSPSDDAIVRGDQVWRMSDRQGQGVGWTVRDVKAGEALFGKKSLDLEGHEDFILDDQYMSGLCVHGHRRCFLSSP